VRPIVDFPEEDFDRVMAVNIRGVFLGMKYVLPRLREGGVVVNMSSALGLVGGAGICAYVASKHAVPPVRIFGHGDSLSLNTYF